MNTASVRVGKTTIFYRQSGASGPPIIFIHGNSMDSKIFKKQMENGLEGSFTLFALDLPGHGKSDRAVNPDTDYSLRAFSNIVAGFAAAVRAEGAVFVGWSLGGHVLLEAAHFLPKALGFVIFGTLPLQPSARSRKAAVILRAISNTLKEDMSTEERRALISSYFREDYPHIPDFLLFDHYETDKKVRSVLAAALEREEFRDEVEVLRTSAKPQAVIHGERDRLIQLAYLKKLRYRNLFTGDIIVIPGAGHAPHWEKPEAFNAVVRDFAAHTVRC